MFSKIVSSVSSALDFNLATLSGCIDIIVVPDEDGKLHSTPFHVRFGKAKLLRSREKVVSVTVNWRTTDLKMTLGSAGEAYFIVEDTRPPGERDQPHDEYDEYFLHHEGEDVSPVVETAEGNAQHQRSTTSPDTTQPASETSSADLQVPQFHAPTIGAETQTASGGGPRLHPDSHPTSSYLLEPATEQPTAVIMREGSAGGTVAERKAMATEEGTITFTEAGPPYLAPSPITTTSTFRGSQIEVSLCGHLLLGRRVDSQHDNDVFQANLIDWQQISTSPELWYHPSTVFRFDGEPPYFPAKTALPLITSWVIYGQSLTAEAFQKLLSGQLRFKDPTNPLVSMQFKAQEILNPRRAFDVSLSELDRPKNDSILRRGRSPTDRRRGDELTAMAAGDRYPQRELASTQLLPRARSMSPAQPTSSGLLGCGGESSAHAYQRLCSKWSICGSPSEEDEAATQFGRIDSISAAEAVTATQLRQMTGIRIVKPAPSAVEEGMLLEHPDGGAPLSSLSPALLAIEEDETTHVHKVKRYRKSLKPTSEQLESLGLKPGPNPITFSVTSALQGTKTVTGTIYLWPRNSKIVVSDVDGTITRSDVWGQLMPIVGRDWSHPGVAELFSNIRHSDYKMLYLTARAIGQADSTRDYLFGLTQNEGNKLPDGPLILSPDRLFPSFKREVIDRKPYVFKIAALRDIRSLFPSFYNPFYAGFGNRDTDHRAYVHVGVPEARIFIVDPTGRVHHVNRTFAKTYESMSQMVVDMFPAVNVYDSCQHLPADEFNSFNYWRIPLNLPDQGTRRFPPLGGPPHSDTHPEHAVAVRDASLFAVVSGSAEPMGDPDDIGASTTAPPTSTTLAIPPVTGTDSAAEATNGSATATHLSVLGSGNGGGIVPVLTSLRLSRWSSARVDPLGDEEELLTAREFGADFGPLHIPGMTGGSPAAIAPEVGNSVSTVSAVGFDLAKSAAMLATISAGGARTGLQWDRYGNPANFLDFDPFFWAASDAEFAIAGGCSRRRCRSDDRNERWTRGYWDDRTGGRGPRSSVRQYQQLGRSRPNHGLGLLPMGTEGAAADELLVLLTAGDEDPVATAIALGSAVQGHIPPNRSPLALSPQEGSQRDATAQQSYDITPAADRHENAHEHCAESSVAISSAKGTDGDDDSGLAAVVAPGRSSSRRRRRVRSCPSLTARQRMSEQLWEYRRLEHQVAKLFHAGGGRVVSSRFSTESLLGHRDPVGSATGMARPATATGRDEEFVEAMSDTSNLLSCGAGVDDDGVSSRSASFSSRDRTSGRSSSSSPSVLRQLQLSTGQGQGYTDLQRRSRANPSSCRGRGLPTDEDIGSDIPQDLARFYRAVEVPIPDSLFIRRRHSHPALPTARRVADEDYPEISSRRRPFGYLADDSCLGVRGIEHQVKRRRSSSVFGTSWEPAARCSELSGAHLKETITKSPPTTSNHPQSAHLANAFLNGIPSSGRRCRQPLQWSRGLGRCPAGRIPPPPGFGGWSLRPRGRAASDGGGALSSLLTDPATRPLVPLLTRLCHLNRGPQHITRHQRGHRCVRVQPTRPSSVPSKDSVLPSLSFSFTEGDGEISVFSDEYTPGDPLPLLNVPVPDALGEGAEGEDSRGADLSSTTSAQHPPPKSFASTHRQEVLSEAREDATANQSVSDMGQPPESCPGSQHPALPTRSSSRQDARCPHLSEPPCITPAEKSTPASSTATSLVPASSGAFGSILASASAMGASLFGGGDRSRRAAAVAAAANQSNPVPTSSNSSSSWLLGGRMRSSPREPPKDFAADIAQLARQSVPKAHPTNGSSSSNSASAQPGVDTRLTTEDRFQVSDAALAVAMAAGTTVKDLPLAEALPASNGSGMLNSTGNEGTNAEYEKKKQKAEDCNLFKSTVALGSDSHPPLDVASGSGAADQWPPASVTCQSVPHSRVPSRYDTSSASDSYPTFSAENEDGRGEFSGISGIRRCTSWDPAVVIPTQGHARRRDRIVGSAEWRGQSHRQW